ncbi:MAG: hypothetical protein WBL62_07835 [Gallionella sp.]
MPYTGVTTTTTAFTGYAYTTVASVNQLSSTLTYGQSFLSIFTDATYTVPSPNWNCQSGVSCTASAPVPAGTVLYIQEGYGVATPPATAPVAVTYTMTVQNIAIIPSQGTVAVPVVIAALPFNGRVGTVADSFYRYTTGVATSLITATAVTADIDPLIFTDATFTTPDANWSCTVNIGTVNDTCTATVPVPAGTVLYMGAINYSAGAGATFRLQ